MERMTDTRGLDTVTDLTIVTTSNLSGFTCRMSLTGLQKPRYHIDTSERFLNF